MDTEDRELFVEKLNEINVKTIKRDVYKRQPEVRTVEMNLGQLEKGGYPHFMLKEIFEQPDCINDCMRGRINADGCAMNRASAEAGGNG